MADELDKLSTGEVSLGLGEENPLVEILTDPEDLNKRNYVKITPTFYVQPVELEEGQEEPEEGEELYKVFNPDTGIAEKRTLTDEERKEIIVRELKNSRINFRNITHEGNTTKVKFNNQYKQKRKKRNKIAKASRRANR